MIVPEIHWEIEPPSSDEATEGATQEPGTLSPSIIEAISKPLISISRTFSNPMGPENGACTLAERKGSCIADRKDSRRHTMSVLTSQFLLVPFSVQLAQGTESTNKLNRQGSMR